MPDLAAMELYCQEAQSLIARAEEAARSLAQNGACEGHRMMAAQGLTAIRHLNRIIEQHRNRLVFEALPNAVGSINQPKRSWLLVLRQRLSPRGASLETRA